jgi:hypothetical protein
MLSQGAEGERAQVEAALEISRTATESTFGGVVTKLSKASVGPSSLTVSDVMKRSRIRKSRPKIRGSFKPGLRLSRLDGVLMFA